LGSQLVAKRDRTIQRTEKYQAISPTEEYLDPYFDDVIEQHLAKQGMLDIETNHQSDFERVLNKMNQLGNRIDALEGTVAADTGESESKEPKTEESDEDHSLEKFL